MSLGLGTVNIGEMHLGSTKIAEAYLGSVKVFGSSELVLPDNTFRYEFTEGYTPTPNWGETWTNVEGNIWDLTSTSYWSWGRQNNTSLLRILGVGPLTAAYHFTTYGMYSGCTNLLSVNADFSLNPDWCYEFRNMFQDCSSLTTVKIKLPPTVAVADNMFSNCTSLRKVPYIDSTFTEVNGMFDGCVNVESGALAMYNHLSSQATPPTNHIGTFYNCGSNTVSGAAELALIPSDWKE